MYVNHFKHKITQNFKKYVKPHQHGIKQILKSQTTKKSHKNKILVTVNAEL